ncbi:SIMPL domain-containing protein [Sessilibacter corallicola]|uniref:SIMPL domain-containing protein n=1 Tax=Sessilibacter corallicola TaxID=2904075 RepID=UPI001E49C642|nr:SIMPL domain-containing protein [Sessilibacter corallicola]MCE2030339.1 SIMPL domain-containing protein [Sessilibacter corallicola]
MINKLNVVAAAVLAVGIHGSALATSIVPGQTELKGSPEALREFLHPRENRVSLSAQAEETAYSDIAIVSLVVSTKEKELAQSIEANGTLRDSIRKTMLAAGVSEEKINNSKFSSSPQYGWLGKKPASFEVVNRMAIEISTEAQLKAIAQITDQYEEVSLSGTEFKHSGKDAFMKQVKEKALAKIKDQQKLYEGQLNVQLTPVAFYDQNVGFRATQGASQIEEVVVTAQRSRESFVDSARSKSSFTSGRTFDEVKYTANITVEFKVVPK